MQNSAREWRRSSSSPVSFQFFHQEETYTSKSIRAGAMDVNRRMVMAFRLMGRGQQPLEQFCGTMNMPGSIAEPSYNGHVAALRDSAKDETEKSMSKAVDDIRHLYTENPDGTVDIGVSGDGTWRKRGFTSFHRVGTAVSVPSGKVVDVSIKSSYCRACSIWENKKGTDPDKYKKWEKKHPPNCHKNYSG